MTDTHAWQSFSIQAKVFDKQPMALHSHLADGTTPEGKKFSVDRSEPTHATFWINYEGRCYEVSLNSIVSGLLDEVTAKQ